MGKSHTMDKSITPLKVPMPKPFHYDINDITLPAPSSQLTSTFNVGTSWITNPTTTATWSNNNWTSRDNLFNNPTGPAAITMSEAKWYLEGKQYHDTQEFCKAANHDDNTTLMWVLTYGNTLPSNPKEVKMLDVSFKN